MSVETEDAFQKELVELFVQEAQEWLQQIHRVSLSCFVSFHLHKADFVFRFLCFLIQDEAQVAGQHVVEGDDRPVDRSLGIDVRVQPLFDVVKITLLSRPQIDKILTVKIK